MQYKSKDEYVDAIQLTLPFAIQLPDGTVKMAQIGDWLVKDSKGSFILTDKEFNEKYVTTPTYTISPYYFPPMHDGTSVGTGLWEYQTTNLCVSSGTIQPYTFHVGS